MPEDRIALLRRGLAAQQAGDLPSAERCFRAVAREHPTDVDAFNLLGTVLINLDRPAEAVDIVQKALELRRDDAQSLANLGLARRALGQLSDAATAFERSLAVRPDHPRTLDRLGCVLREQGRLDDSIQSHERAVRLDPTLASGWCNLAAAYCEHGRYDRASSAAQRALALDVSLAEARVVLGDIERRQTRWSEARSQYERALSINPRLTSAHLNLADVLRHLGDTAASERLLRSALEIEPRNGHALHSLGILMEQMGRRDAASEYLVAAIEAVPRLTAAHYQLAQIKGRPTSDAELQQRLALYAEPDIPDAQRAQLAYALSIGLEQRGDYAQAFARLTEAKTVQAARRPYDHAQSVDYARRIARAFSDSQVVGKPGWNAPRAAIRAAELVPVFVVGMPRSGTSLTEQILASHPSIAGAGEVGFMEETVREAGRLVGRQYPECVRLLDSTTLRRLGDQYLERVRPLASTRRYVVDKTPMNFQYVGLIRLMLPDARILHCHRSPLDNCLSIFQRPFDESQAYAHDLTSLGRYYGLYRALMRFWHSALPDFVMDVEYESTVGNVEAQSRRILAHVGVEFDPQVLQFYLTQRQVRTPSAGQVRQAIYSDSIGAWKRYEPWLEPLRIALGEEPEICTASARGANR